MWLPTALLLHWDPRALCPCGGTGQEDSNTPRPRAKEISRQDEYCVLSFSHGANYFSLMLLLNVSIREKWRRWSRAGCLPAEHRAAMPGESNPSAAAGL